MTDRLGVEFLTALGLPPVEFVEMTAKLGCRHISAMLSGNFVNPNGYPDFDLRTDAAMRADVAAALRDNDVSISLAEGFIVLPGADVRDYVGDLDLMLGLGAGRVNIVSMDPDLPRSLDQFGLFAELAAAAGMTEIVSEFAPVLTVRDLPMALDALQHVGRSDFRLLIDTMHLCRTGGTAADLAALDPDLIGYIQLCDAPEKPVIADYMQEAMTERLTPGEGELPLKDILAVIPPHVVISLEVPQCARAVANSSRLDTVGSIVAAARRMVDPVGA